MEDKQNQNPDEDEKKSTVTKIAGTIFIILLVVMIFLSLRSFITHEPVGPLLYIVGGLTLLAYIVEYISKKMK